MHLNIPASVLETQLRARIAEADDLIDVLHRPEEGNSRKKSYFLWDDHNVSLIKVGFAGPDWTATSPLSEYRTAGLPVADLNLNRGHPISDARVESLIDVVRTKQGILRSFIARLGIYAEPHSGALPDAQGDAIFVVHGHAHLEREEVRRFLKRVTTREIVTLDEEPNTGRDVLGKLLAHAHRAAYAVVLLTGDDEGRVRGSGQWRIRARQNVVLELGLFVGLLGRDKVAVLHESGVEIPSDFAGILYTRLDSEGAWRLKLATELRSSGIAVDLNKAV